MAIILKYDSKLVYKLLALIHSEIALRWIPQNLTDEMSTLVHVRDWCRQAISHYLSNADVAGPQYVDQISIVEYDHTDRNAELPEWFCFPLISCHIYILITIRFTERALPYLEMMNIPEAQCDLWFMMTSWHETLSTLQAKILGHQRKGTVRVFSLLCEDKQAVEQRSNFWWFETPWRSYEASLSGRCVTFVQQDHWLLEIVKWNKRFGKSFHGRVRPFKYPWNRRPI